MNRTVKTVLVYLLVITVAITLVNAFVNSATAPEEYSLDEFSNHLAAGDVATVTIKQKSNVVEVSSPRRLAGPGSAPHSPTATRVTSPRCSSTAA